MSDGPLHYKLRMRPTADTAGNDLPSFFPQLVQFFFQLLVFGMPYNLVLPHGHAIERGLQGFSHRARGSSAETRNRRSSSWAYNSN